MSESGTLLGPTLSSADFHVPMCQQRANGKGCRETTRAFGGSTGALCESSLQEPFLLRTLPQACRTGTAPFVARSKPWVIERPALASMRPTSGRRTDARGYLFWPTPVASGNHNRARLSIKSGDGLSTAVRRWPTPTASDWRGRSESPHRQGGPPLSMAVKERSLNQGSLNPAWVEMLMGAPQGWTRIDGPLVRERSSIAKSRKER